MPLLPPLLRFTLRRAGALVVLCFGISVVAFLLTTQVPADPVTANLGQAALADPAAVRAFREHYGLNKPLPVQYILYVDRLLHGNLGESEQSHRPVLADLEQYVPATAELTVAAMLIAYVVGITTGVISAVRRGRLADTVIRVLTLVGVSVPIFWLALIALFVFFYLLGWVPGGGRLSPAIASAPSVTGFYTIDALLAGDWGVFVNALQHLALPACVLAANNIGMITRFTRASLLEVLGKDYILAAQAKGLRSRTVILQHALRAALPPILTVSGLAFANVLTGTVLVETIFSWPGIGQYAFRSATTLDLPAIMGVTLFIAFVYAAINMVIDLLHTLVDPRVHVA